MQILMVCGKFYIYIEKVYTYKNVEEGIVKGGLEMFLANSKIIIPR